MFIFRKSQKTACFLNDEIQQRKWKNLLKKVGNSSCIYVFAVVRVEYRQYGQYDTIDFEYHN